MVGLYCSASILAGRASDPFVAPPCRGKVVKCLGIISNFTAFFRPRKRKLLQSHVHFCRLLICLYNFLYQLDSRVTSAFLISFVILDELVVASLSKTTLVHKQKR